MRFERFCSSEGDTVAVFNSNGEIQTPFDVAGTYRIPEATAKNLVLLDEKSREATVLPIWGVNRATMICQDLWFSPNLDIESLDSK